MAHRASDAMIDSHCHLDFPVFDDNRAAILNRCHQLGIQRIMIPGTRPECWEAQQALATKYDNIDIALGLHPYFIANLATDQVNSAMTHLAGILAQEGHAIKAVGETGLDYSEQVLQSAGGELQRQCFSAQLALAAEHGLPVIVHHRQSHNDIMHGLKRHPGVTRGVIHAYSGSYEQAMAYIERGFLLGVGGTITYMRARKTRNALSRVPLTGLLLETDAPDMPLCGMQGKPNTPVNLPRILTALSQIRQQDEDEIVRQTDTNYGALFS